jgi:short-subunit dehydrogenase
MFFSVTPSSVRTPQTRGFSLVTGAAAGIGCEFAQALAAQNRPLVLIDRAEQPLRELAEQLSDTHAVQVFWLAQDLGCADGPQRVFDFCQQRHIEVDLLINNAAVGVHAPLEDQPADRIEEMVRVNILSVVGLTQLFLKEMKQRGHGTIVNLSSAGIFDPCPEWSVYAATKAFVLHFTESLQREVSGTGVDVVALCPGMTKTSFFEKAGHEVPREEQVQSAHDVVNEALQGLKHHQPLIVTGRFNRLKVQAQRANLRWLLSGVKRSLRRVAVFS